VLREHRVDVVHAHNFGRFLYAGPAARLARVPVALYTEHSRTQPHERVLWLAQRRVSRLAQKVAAVSDNVRDHLVQVQGLPADRVVTILNGIDLDAYRLPPAERAAARAELGLPPEAVVAGTVARLVPVKNQAMLLRAAARVPGLWLALAGDGELRTDLEQLAGELGIADRVRFLGLRRDVPRVLAALDVFVMTSESEGLPIAMIEAMAAGLPVVATEVGGIPELVADGVSGRLVPANDHEAAAAALAALASDPAQRHAFGRAGCDAAGGKYSISAMVRAYTAIYEAGLTQVAG
jgi:glycosyltransferase involved in cell wall biosynthesis